MDLLAIVAPKTIYPSEVTSASQAIYDPLLGKGLPGVLENSGHCSHAGPMSIHNHQPGIST